MNEKKGFYVSVKDIIIVGQAQSVTGAAVIVVNIDYIENEKTKSH